MFIFLLIFTTYGGCQSQKTAQKSEEQSSVQQEVRQDTAKKAVVPSSPMPTAIKQNLTAVGVLVESVVLLDSINYKISFVVNTAIPHGGFESIAEVGQRITASPSYVVSEDGTIDMNNERNKRLFNLREAVSNDIFIGKISLTDKHGWVIVDVDAFK